ncbi:MAG: hypothetical protein IJU27_02115 [Bacteroidales bacterium]|nr:hypothetical protein [Bacteroidales bacterium]
MKQSRFFVIFALLAVAQILLNNYLNLSQWVVVTLLPAMIMCIPQRINSVLTMLIAFGVSLLVDFLSTGVMGLTAVALVPVALLRNPLLHLVFGTEIFERQENISIGRHGILKIALVQALALLVYLIIYIIADGAGTRPVWFNLVRLLLSTIVGTAVSILTFVILSSEDSR